MPRISVIMPVYNADKYIEKSISSVLNQTYTDLELIIINDGSTDNTKNIISKIQKEDNRIILIEKKNSGVSASRNKGIKRAKGQFISFVDADDYLELDAYEKMLNAIDKTGAENAICSHYLTYSEKNKKIDLVPFSEGLHFHEEIRKKLIKPLLEDRISKNLVLGSVWRFLFNRKKIIDSGIKFSGAYLEDEIFLIEYFSFDTNLVCVNEPLYNYFQNENSVTKKYMEGYVETFKLSLNKKKELVKKYKIDVNSTWIYNTCWQSLLIAVSNEFALGNSCTFNEKIKNIKKICEIPEFSQAIKKYSPTGMNKNKTIVANLIRKKAYSLLCKFYLIKNKYYNIKEKIIKKFFRKFNCILDKTWEQIHTSKVRKIFSNLYNYIKQSTIVKFLIGDHSISFKWNNSLICRLLLWFFNLFPNLLYKIYKKNPKLFKNSLFIKYLDKLTIFVICFLVILMFVVPQEKWSNLYSLIFSFIALLFYMISGMINKKNRIDFKGIGTYPVIFFIICICSTILSNDVSSSIRFFIFYITCMIFVLVFVNAVKTEKQLMVIIMCIGMGLLISSLYAMYQRYVGVEFNLSYSDINANPDMPGRVYSFFENPNSFATLLALFIPLMITSIKTYKNKIIKIFFVIICIVSMVALIMTYSRGGWVSIAVSVFVLIILYLKKYILIFIILGILLIPFLPSAILTRILTIFTGDLSTSLRLETYLGTYGVICDNFLTGVGLGMNALRGIVYSGGYYIMSRGSFVHAHNIFLQICAESGIFAVVFFALSIIYVIVKCYKNFFNNKITRGLKNINAGCLASLCGILVFGIFEYAWSYPRMMVLYWLLFAISSVALKLNDETIEKVREKK